jgi:AcrR family transcriptional regulator
VRRLRERGYGALSIEQVAADAGVAKATIYRRYRNKADLTTAALASVSAKRMAAPFPDDTREALVDHLERIEAGMTEVGFGVIGAMIEERDQELLELHRERAIRPGRERGTAILRRAQERGELRPDADPDTVMEMLVGSLFARRMAGSRAPGWPEVAVDALLKGLAL